MQLAIFAGRVMKNVNDDEIQNRFVYKISILASHNSKHSEKGDYFAVWYFDGICRWTGIRVSTLEENFLPQDHHYGGRCQY